MALELSKNLWDELKRYINVVDRSDAAASLIEMLVEHDYDPEDIKSAFKSDPDVKRAIASYIKDHEEEHNDDEDEDYEEDYDEDDEEY